MMFYEWLVFSDWRMALGCCCMTVLCLIPLGPVVLGKLLWEAMRRDVARRYQ